jgi:mono/diheme cytochrome c family protein
MCVDTFGQLSLALKYALIFHMNLQATQSKNKKQFGWLALAIGLLLLAQPVLADGTAARGLKFAEQHCSRCHVVGTNKFGGIGSTPSFRLFARMMLKKEQSILVRFRTFYLRPPHPPFVQVDGVARSTKDLPTIAQFEVNQDNLEDIIAYVQSLKKAL